MNQVMISAARCFYCDNFIEYEVKEDNNGYIEISVVPCSQCIEKAEDEGFEKAKIQLKGEGIDL